MLNRGPLPPAEHSSRVVRGSTLASRPKQQALWTCKGNASSRLDDASTDAGTPEAGVPLLLADAMSPSSVKGLSSICPHFLAPWPSRCSISTLRAGSIMLRVHVTASTVRLPLPTRRRPGSVQHANAPPRSAVIAESLSGALHGNVAQSPRRGQRDAVVGAPRAVRQLSLSSVSRASVRR